MLPGDASQKYAHPVKTNQIPRQVPDQLWYMHPYISMLIAGILPFGAVFIELFFILTVRALMLAGVRPRNCPGSSSCPLARLPTRLRGYMYMCAQRLSGRVWPIGPTHSAHRVVFVAWQAIWENQFYYLFGFLFLVFAILALSCGEIAIVMTYLQLCSEVSLFVCACEWSQRRCR